MAWVLRVLGSTVVVDWHNLAFTIMEQTLRKEHPFIAPAKLYERAFSSAGDAHLCVTSAMQALLPTCLPAYLPTAYRLLPTAYH